MKTIGVDLWAGQQRGAGDNRPTVVYSPGAHRPAVGMPLWTLRELFTRAYASFAPTCRAVTEPGIAVVAVDERSGRAMGMATVMARVDRHVAAIVGRHDRADLFLDAFDELALRHLAVIVDPLASWERGGAISYRILDLRTGDGFVDEHGTRLRGLRCEGAAVLRCAGYAIYALPLGDVTDWPEGADDAWSFLPERVYFDEIAGLAEGTSPRVSRAPVGRATTMVRTAGPREAGARLVSDGDEIAELELAGPERRVLVRVGRAALQTGVLVGRYERCQGQLDTGDLSLSRVHVLLIAIGDRVVAVDTASTFGTFARGERIRVATLRGASELRLASGTTLRWIPAQG